MSIVQLLPAPAAQEPEQEEPSQQTQTDVSRMYEGTVIVKTGPSSYRVRIAGNQDIRVLTREDLRAGMHIRFILDERNIITSLTIIE